MDRSAPVTEALTRPSGAGQAAEQLSAWDDYPIHQTPAPLGAVSPDLPGFAERFYFNLLRPTGKIAALIGGGIYPVRGVAECYYCRFDGDRQLNLRTWSELPRPGAEAGAGPFSFSCEIPLRDWRVEVNAGEAQFSGRFRGATEPYLYAALDIPASEDGGEYDQYRHFVAMGEWDLDAFDAGGRSDAYIGVRDRTWGVRTRRIRLHNWYVLRVGGSCLNLIHQELADGSVFFSEAGAVHPDGRVEALQLSDHDLRYDPETREVIEGVVQLVGEQGELRLEYERIGPAMRLAGAGYDDRQGARQSRSGDQCDDYDLADPAVAKATGRGTMDAGVRAAVTGAWSGEGIGVVETAVARDHVKYGEQIA